MNPRAAMLGQLFAVAQAAALAGDMEAARIAHGAIGKLLGPPPSEGTPVVDLARERARRPAR